MSLKMKYTEVNPLILYFPSVYETQTYFTAYKIKKIRFFICEQNHALLSRDKNFILFGNKFKNVRQLRKVNFVHGRVKGRLARPDLHFF